MKNIYVLVFGCLFLLMSSVQAYEDVTIENYRGLLSEKFSEYSAEFADCFPTLPAGFPSLPLNSSELIEWVDDVSVDRWYHRTILFFGQEVDEVFFLFNTGMEYYGVRVIYLINPDDESLQVHTVEFYGSSSGLESELYYMTAIPEGVSDKSLEEIAACMKATPGFEMVAVLGSLIALVLLFKRRH